MTYFMTGLDPAPFGLLFTLGDEALAARGMARIIADSDIGFPCRILLDDVSAGDELVLLNHVSHAEPGPYRASHAIFVSAATKAARYTNRVAPALDRRVLSLRAFDRHGMMTDAALVQPGKADRAIRRMISDATADHIDAHYAVRGCFAARIERTEQ